MSKYKVGDKVVMEILRTDDDGYYEFGNDNRSWWWFGTYINEISEPLSTYTEPLEAKIRSHEAYINDLLLVNERLSKEKKDCIEQARAEGAEAAWELARKIASTAGGLSSSELIEIFNSFLPRDILSENTYPEAAAKVVQWEKAKAKADGSCDSCKFELTDPYFDPCFSCRHRYLSKYEPKAGEQE